MKAHLRLTQEEIVKAIESHIKTMGYLVDGDINFKIEQTTGFVGKARYYLGITEVPVKIDDSEPTSRPKDQ